MQTSQPLRGALLANATFSLATGALAWAAPVAIAEHWGVSQPLFILALGPGLVLFSALLLWTAMRPTLNPRLAFAITLADFGWVLGTVALLALAGDQLNGTGRAWVIVIAIVVAALGVSQLLGIARLYRGDGVYGGHRTTLVAERRVAAPGADVWPLIADVEGYDEVAPNIAYSRIVSGERDQLVRECADHDGGTWCERAALWDEGRRYAFEIDTDAPDYPYPFRALRGQWEVEPDGEACIIRMRFDFTLPGGWLGDVMGATILVPKFEPIVETILDRWQQRAERGRVGG